MAIKNRRTKNSPKQPAKAKTAQPLRIPEGGSPFMPTPAEMQRALAADQAWRRVYDGARQTERALERLGYVLIELDAQLGLGEDALGAGDRELLIAMVKGVLDVPADCKAVFSDLTKAWELTALAP